MLIYQFGQTALKYIGKRQRMKRFGQNGHNETNIENQCFTMDGSFIDDLASTMCRSWTIAQMERRQEGTNDEIQG